MRSKIITSLFVAGVLLATPLTSQTASALSLSRLPVPAGIHAAPGVGSVTVSWVPLAQSAVTYTVSSMPVGKSCQVIDAASCSFSVTTSTKFRYRVTAAAAGWLPSSTPLTGALPHRLILILAGQSNVEGAESYAIDPSTLVNYFASPYLTTADSLDKLLWLPWNELPAKTAGPVSLDAAQYAMTATGGKGPHIFGPEIGLARQSYADTLRPLTIIKASLGAGTLASYWLPGSPTNAYAGLVSTVLHQMAADAALGKLDTIGGVYWYQGESDSLNASDAASYATNLSSMIGGLRSDLPMDPTAPVALAKSSLAPWISFARAFGSCPPDNCDAYALGDEQVRAADDWVATTLPHVVTVDTADLPRAPLAIHLTNIAELTLGERLAQATDLLMP